MRCLVQPHRDVRLAGDKDCDARAWRGRHGGKVPISRRDEGYGQPGEGRADGERIMAQRQDGVGKRATVSAIHCTRRAFD
jgi:hypothetical protein